MLSYLSISHLAILDEVSLEPGPGLNVLTGETGAGKSIVVDAIGLILGGRAEASMVRTGSDRLIVEAQFDLSARPDLSKALSEGGPELDLSGGELVIRREVPAGETGGRGRVLINGRLATLPELRLLGEALADLHGQHQHQSLLTSRGQREAVDGYAGNEDRLRRTSDRAARVRALTLEREALASRDADRKRLIEDLRRRVAEIEAVAPHPGEDEALEREESLLRNAGEVARLSAEAFALVSEDDGSVLSRLAAASDRAGRLASFDRRAEEIRALLEEARVAAAEAARGLSGYGSAEEFSPDRLEAVAARLAALDRIKRRYGPALADVQRMLEEARAELAGLEGTGQRLEAIDEELRTAWRDYGDACEALSAHRQRAAVRLAAAARTDMAALAMEGATLTIEVSQPEADRLSPFGRDDIRFVMSANAGEEPRPLARVASGGELSRLMLALRNAGGPRGDRRTLIFDEVDSGIGGRVADAVGQRLLSLASSQQVFCVTHLPQIAAFADRHFHVSKRSSAGRTVARVHALDADGRVEELARMMGGMPPDSARRHAEALLKSARAARAPGRRKARVHPPGLGAAS